MVRFILYLKFYWKIKFTCIQICSVRHINRLIHIYHNIIYIYIFFLFHFLLYFFVKLVEFVFGKWVSIFFYVLKYIKFIGIKST